MKTIEDVKRYIETRIRLRMNNINWPYAGGWSRTIDGLIIHELQQLLKEIEDDNYTPYDPFKVLEESRK